MRTEMSKGTPLGEQIKGIVQKGGLVPFEVTVELLINGLIANPSKVSKFKNYKNPIKL
jgi:adenylate kinase family enzyme